MVELPDDPAELQRRTVAAAAGGAVLYREAEQLVAALVARVRAEAVAAERQRWERLVQAHMSLDGVGGPDQAARNSVLRQLLVAGSVPVATPPRVEVASIPLDELPDWTDLAEAAGATLQNHEIGCSGEYETVMHWSDGRRAGNRDRLAIISEDAEMEQFAKAVVGPVATRLQPGRVGFGTDAFEVGGSLPGQPVATPTEPAIPARLMSLEAPDDAEADERGIDGLLATFDVPAGNAWPAGEYSILAPASPVPAEQLPACSTCDGEGAIRQQQEIGAPGTGSELGVWNQLQPPRA